MTKGSLAGRRALVTGAAAGIGRATVLKLAAAGAAIEAVDRDAAGLETLRQEITASGGTVRARVLDLGRPAEVEPLWTRIEAEGGTVDLLLNVAGIGLRATVLQTTGL
jgi:3-hydroxybutyrate dehydrogenase